MPDAKFLRIYLNDHLVTASAGAAVARRSQKSNAGTDRGALLATIADDLADDLASLERIMRERGIRPSPLRKSLGKIGERVGLLKLNGRATGASPLTPLVELEGIGLLVGHNASLWRSLETIGVPGAAELAERAERHAEELRTERRAAAQTALGNGTVQ